MHVKAKIGGKFDVRGSLTLAQGLGVGGAISVREVLTAERLELGGSLETRRAILSDLCEVGGNVTTQEGLKAARIRLQRKSRARGPLVGQTIEIERSAHVDDLFGGEITLEERAEARRIFGARVRLRDGASADEILYTDSVEVDARARVRSPPRKVDTLPPFPL